MNEIFDTIIKDLTIYSQSNPHPSSVTFDDKEDNFRHYELSTVFGLCCFAFGDSVMFTEVKEDDGYWFCFSGTHRDYSDAGWIKTKIELYTRMQKWMDDNLQRGYYHGQEGKPGFECGYRTF